MFIPLGRVSFRDAAIRLATRIADRANHENPNGPDMCELAFLVESYDDLGRNLAAGWRIGLQIDPKSRLCAAGWQL